MICRICDRKRDANLLMEIIHSSAALEVRDRLRPGMRILFAVLAFIPMLAPYELIVRPRWESYVNLPFLFVFVISVGAMALSGILVFAAVAGLNSRMSFDSVSRTFTYSRNAPLVPLRTFRYSFVQVDLIDVETHEWSDGEPTFSLRVFMKDGCAYGTGSSFDRAQVEEACRLAREILKG